MYSDLGQGGTDVGLQVVNPLMQRAPDHPGVKIKNHGLGQYGAEPNYSTLPFWQLCALKG